MSDTLQKYKKQSVPKWWEWIPVISFTYESRMTNTVRDYLPNDPVRQEIVKTFNKAFMYSLGLVYIMLFITPLFSYLIARKAIENIEK